MTSVDLRDKKTKLRRESLDIRNAISLDARADYSKKICENILSSFAYKFSENILMFYPIKSEPDILKVFEKAIKDGKSVYFPKTFEKGRMEFYKVESLSDLYDGKMSLKEPRDDGEKFDKDDKTLCLVPGVCFDKRGYRIGYGKGFYDRFIKKNEIIYAGVCFDELLKDEIIFDKRHDKKADMIFTQERVYVVGEKKE